MGKLNSKLFIAVVVLGLATADEQAGAIDHSPLLSSLVEKTSETTMTKSRAAKDYSRQAGRRGGTLSPTGSFPTLNGGGQGAQGRGANRKALGLVEKTSETTKTKSRAAKDYSRQAGRRGGFMDPGGVMFGGGGGGRSRGRGRL
jgi:hypothetical protein